RHASERVPLLAHFPTVCLVTRGSGKPDGRSRIGSCPTSRVGIRRSPPFDRVAAGSPVPPQHPGGRVHLIPLRRPLGSGARLGRVESRRWPRGGIHEPSLGVAPRPGRETVPWPRGAV